MIKDILWDADDVVVVKREGFFSEKLAKRQGIPLEQVMPFFKGEFGLCTVGKADLKQEIGKYLAGWGWTGTVEELMEYWFSSEKEVDTEVLEVVDGLRQKGVKCYLATDQEKYRVRYLLEEMKLGEHFDGQFFSCDLGVKKSHTEFFEEILRRLGVEPEEVMYWDDDEKNVAVAHELGIDARLFTSPDDVRSSVNRYV